MTMAALLLLSACAEEVEVARSGQLPSLYGGKEPYTGTDVTFTVYDSFDPTGTRAAVNGYETTFENGDAIGVYTVTPQGVVRAANVKVTFNGTTWAPATKIVNSPDLIYYAYYPYQASPAGPPAANATVTAGVGADEFFKLLVAKWQVEHDQSTKANYNASDLCISRSIATKSNSDGSGEVAFTLNHKMALAVLTLKPKTVTLTTTTVYNYFDRTNANIQWTETSISSNTNYSLPASTTWGSSTFSKPTAWNSDGSISSTTTVTVTNKPYCVNPTDNVYYFICRPISNYIIRATSNGTSDYEKGAWTQQVAIASGRYDGYTPTITDGNKTQTVNMPAEGRDYPIQVGMYYYTDRTYSLTRNYSKTLVGLVVYVNNIGYAYVVKDGGCYPNGATYGWYMDNCEVYEEATPRPNGSYWNIFDVYTLGEILQSFGDIDYDLEDDGGPFCGNINAANFIKLLKDKGISYPQSCIFDDQPWLGINCIVATDITTTPDNKGYFHFETVLQRSGAYDIWVYLMVRP